MSDEIKQQPVAIRVTRPYATPDDFLEHELETLTRTSITLLGAQPRPKGVILRFEVAMPGGGQLLRGEGRVVGYKENAFGDQPGLVLRFTRLDTKSKALVDKAAAIREGRARAALQAAMGEDSIVPSASPGSVPPPPSFAPPISVGPVSIPQAPPSDTIVGGLPREVIARAARVGLSSPTQPGMPAPPHMPPPIPSPDPSFDEATFLAPSSTELAPTPPSSDPLATPSAPPSAVSQGSGRPGQDRDMEQTIIARANEPARNLDSLPRDSSREQLLERLRERASQVTGDRLNALRRS